MSTLIQKGGELFGFGSAIVVALPVMPYTPLTVAVVVTLVARIVGLIVRDSAEGTVFELIVRDTLTLMVIEERPAAI